MLWKYIMILILVAIGFYVCKYFLLIHRTKGLMSESSKYSQDYYIGKKTDKPINYVVLGDSTAEGTGSTKIEHSYPYITASSLASHKKYVHILNYAVSGAKSEDIPGQIAKISAMPDYISLTVGANDATHFVSEQKYKKNLEKIKTLLDKYPLTKIIISNTPRMGDTPALKYIPAYFINKRAQDQNEIFVKVFSEPKYKIVNLSEDARLESKLGNKLYATDLFHPSNEGYLIWSKFFIQATNS